MKGRAAGYCAGYTMPGYANPGVGRGYWGRGGGWGRGGERVRGWRHGNYAPGLPGPAAYPPAWGRGWPYAATPASPVAREQELEVLRGQAEYLEQTLGEILKRLEKLQTAGTKD